MLLYHHLGLGDHIICNGMVRHFSKIENEVIIFCKKHNYISVKFMFRDLNNVNIIQVNDDNEADKIFNNLKEDKKIKVGFVTKDNISFDEFFYNMVDVKFNKRWDYFFVKRDFIQEQKLICKYGINKPYAFVHDDVDRNFVINVDGIKNNIVRPLKNMTKNIFEYIGLIEEADEIHCIDSSFRCLIDSLENVTQKLYYHKYARCGSKWEIPKTNKNWIVL